MMDWCSCCRVLVVLLGTTRVSLVSARQRLESRRKSLAPTPQMLGARLQSSCGPLSSAATTHIVPNECASDADEPSENARAPTSNRCDDVEMTPGTARDTRACRRR